MADVVKAGGILDTSVGLYGEMGAKLRQQPVIEWKWQSGAKVIFGHLEHDKTVLDWQGAQVPLICFDELTHFSRSQFFYMLSRNRSTCGVRPYVRATCNPDANSWVAEFIAWWIDPDTGLAIEERAGVLRWFVRVNNVLAWGDSPEELKAEYGDDCLPKSVTFVPARLEHNAILVRKDPGYRANLMALPMVDRERLLGGNWKIRPAAGLYFKRSWCTIVDAVPVGTHFVRGWDLAATEKTEHNDPDWTCGTKIGRMPDGRFIIADHVRLRSSPAEVEKTLVNVASADTAEVKIALPQDPAQAGKAQARNLIKLLAGYEVRTARASGSKVTRFGPFSAQAEAGNVLVLRGAWNDDYFTALEMFPDAKHDDDANSTSEAFNHLVSAPQVTLTMPVSIKRDGGVEGISATHRPTSSPTALGVGIANTDGIGAGFSDFKDI